MMKSVPLKAGSGSYSSLATLMASSVRGSRASCTKTLEMRPCRGLRRISRSQVRKPSAVANSMFSRAFVDPVMCSTFVRMANLRSYEKRSILDGQMRQVTLAVSTPSFMGTKSDTMYRDAKPSMSFGTYASQNGTQAESIPAPTLCPSSSSSSSCSAATGLPSTVLMRLLVSVTREPPGLNSSDLTMGQSSVESTCMERFPKRFIMRST
mmetsp:Transcript_2861/g.8269  ORF Transcript_2861/g.8269 Transcript_2861/m.8269 type:complete len:209 (-) Transcript_2861:2695-3321(-)